MTRQSNIPAAHPLITWVQPLVQWGELLKKMGKAEAIAQVWPNEAHVHAWIEKGTALLTQCRVAGKTAHALVELIGSGAIDAQGVENLLALQGWEHASLSDYDYGEKDNAEYFPLLDSWQIAVGNATVLERGQYQTCDARANWLNQGLGFFELILQEDAESEGIPLVNDAHLVWLQELCTAQPWARQTVAQWLIDEPSRSPLWTWVFNEELGQRPSAEFLDSVLHTLDDRAKPEQMHHWEHVLREERLTLMAEQAPMFFKQIQELHSMHLALYGEVPLEFQPMKDYCQERAQLIAGTMGLHYAGNAESLDASTKPSMDKLFCDDAPSIAL